METREFLEYTQNCIELGEIERAIEKYKEVQGNLRHNSESATLAIIFAIHESEMELNEISFFEGRNTIEELMDCYNQLKLYLRRFDFDVHYDTTEFVEFVKTNHISSTAIFYVIQTSMVHPAKVLNEAAKVLEHLAALREMISV